MLQLFSCLKALWPCVHISCVHPYTHWIIKLLWQIYLSAKTFLVVCMASLTIYRTRTRGGRTLAGESEQICTTIYALKLSGCVSRLRHSLTSQISSPFSIYISTVYQNISAALCFWDSGERTGGGKKRELAQRDVSLVFVLHCSTVLNWLNCAEGTDRRRRGEEKLIEVFFPSSLHWTLNMPSDIKTLRRRDKNVISSGRHRQMSTSRVSSLDLLQFELVCSECACTDSSV